MRLTTWVDTFFSFKEIRIETDNMRRYIFSFKEIRIETDNMRRYIFFCGVYNLYILPNPTKLVI